MRRLPCDMERILKSNPAIFVNHETYHLLGKHHRSWEKNKTIAVKESVLEKKPIMVIGIIVHETGHAFNVAACITNSEANAYIFEIEVLSFWFKTNSPLLFSCSKSDLQSFFESRLPFYRSATTHNAYLASLVYAIETDGIFAPVEEMPSAAESKCDAPSPRLVIPTPKSADDSPLFFFKRSPSHSALSEGQLLPQNLAANSGAG